MDPTACLRDIFDHIQEGDYDEARESLSNLCEWLAKDGFLPTFPDRARPLLLDEWTGVRNTLQQILDQAQDTD